MKIDRLISIIMLLLEREQITAEELAQRFEVSARTIYRDLDAINGAGIPIAALPGPGNGVRIMDSYRVEKRLFSTPEIAGILLALGSMQGSLKLIYRHGSQAAHCSRGSIFCRRPWISSALSHLIIGITADR